MWSASTSCRCLSIAKGCHALAASSSASCASSTSPSSHSSPSHLVPGLQPAAPGSGRCRRMDLRQWSSTLPWWLLQDPRGLVSWIILKCCGQCYTHITLHQPPWSDTCQPQEAMVQEKTPISWNHISTYHNQFNVAFTRIHDKHPYHIPSSDFQCCFEQGSVKKCTKATSFLLRCSKTLDIPADDCTCRLCGIWAMMWYVFSLLYCFGRSFRVSLWSQYASARHAICRLYIDKQRNISKWKPCGKCQVICHPTTCVTLYLAHIYAQPSMYSDVMLTWSFKTVHATQSIFTVTMQQRGESFFLEEMF